MPDPKLPHWLKYPGWFLACAGTLLGILYFLIDFRLKMPVFALVSSFLQTKYFATFRTNVADELILLALISGSVLVIFSKEKPESVNDLSLKGKALFRALFWNSILLFLSVMFFYGQAFIVILIINTFSIFFLYLFFFYFLRVRERKAECADKQS
jgi:hypothetical protein